MSSNSNIEWTDHTFNPWMGCTKVAPACDHCYAERSTPSRTLGVKWGAGQLRRRTGADNWELPKRWNAQAEAFHAQHGRRQRVFCASLADVFDNEVVPEWRLDLLDKIRQTPSLDWLLLTKRIGNVRHLLSECLALTQDQMSRMQCENELANWLGEWVDGRPPANVWLGATITSQAEADRDIPKLLAAPARVRFLSMEPLLGPVDLTSIEVKRQVGVEVFSALEYDGHPDEDVELGTATLDWVIVGGESGPGARPMHPDWAGGLRDQCQAAGVPFLFKQWGEWWPISQMHEADYNALYRSRIKAKPHESQDALDDCYGRVCTVEDGVIHFDGSLHGITEPMSFRVGTGAMQAFKVGKKAAGRLLDGVQHDGYPA